MRMRYNGRRKFQTLQEKTRNKSRKTKFVWIFFYAKHSTQSQAMHGDSTKMSFVNTAQRIPLVGPNAWAIVFLRTPNAAAASGHVLELEMWKIPVAIKITLSLAIRSFIIIVIIFLVAVCISIPYSGEFHRTYADPSFVHIVYASLSVRFAFNWNSICFDLF